MQNIVKKLLEQNSEEIHFRLQETLLIHIITMLVKEQGIAMAQHKEGITRSIDILMTYLESLRDSYSK